jgi:hypothetical protein
MESMTLFDVVVMAPAAATPLQMQNLALAKLKRKLESERGGP